MEYNTTKSKLINGEYGRHIQKMVEYAVDIKDRHLRTQQAHAIVRTMSLFSQGVKDTEDYWHTLWDHLFILSDYKLNVDAPFPMPEREIAMRTKRMNYPKHEIRFRPYGYLIEKIIKQVTTEEDCAEKEQTVINVANHLKKQYLNWNRDSVNDELIAEHLQDLSQGKLELHKNFRFADTKTILNDIGTGVNGVGTPKNNNANGANGNNNGKNKKKKKKKPMPNNMPFVSVPKNKMQQNKQNKPHNPNNPNNQNKPNPNKPNNPNNNN
jgi:hypothetical protein